MKERTSRSWIPFWTDKWLYGSMRLEFNAEERAIWIDLLALANKDDGWIRANEDIPYPLEQLAGMLVLPKELLKKSIAKFVRKRKLTRAKNGTLYITNWDKYSFTDRHKRRVMSEKTDTMSEKTDPILDKIREEKIRKEKKREEKRGESERGGKGKKKKPTTPTKKISFSFEDKRFFNITEEDIAGWKEAYPACDIKAELRKMREWLLANPEKRKVNYRRFIVNWLSKQQDRGGSKRAIGAPFRSMTKKEERKERIKDWATGKKK